VFEAGHAKLPGQQEFSSAQSRGPQISALVFRTVDIEGGVSGGGGVERTMEYACESANELVQIQLTGVKSD
jgi:hypothetical protein